MVKLSQVPILKKDKGKAMSMLHFAAHRFGWKYLYEDQQDPDKEHFYDLQIDPTMLLIQLKNKADMMEHLGCCVREAIYRSHV